jgi:hypothetical protein
VEQLPGYGGAGTAPGFLARERVLALFSDERSEASRGYRALVRAGLHDADPKQELLGTIRPRRTLLGRQLATEGRGAGARPALKSVAL